MPQRRWTPDEDRLLCEQYPRGGSKAVQAAGVRRSFYAIKSRARAYGLPNPVATGRPAAQRPASSELLTDSEERVLIELLHADQREALLDQRSLPTGMAGALKGLRRRQLAMHVGDGLWRLSLRGVAEGRRLEGRK